MRTAIKSGKPGKSVIAQNWPVYKGILSMPKKSFWEFVSYLNPVEDKDPEIYKTRLRGLDCDDLMVFSRQFDDKLKILEHCGVITPESTYDFARISDDTEYYTFFWVILMGEQFFKMIVENPIPSRSLFKYLLGNDAFFDLTEIGENFVVSLSEVMEERKLY